MTFVVKILMSLRIGIYEAFLDKRNYIFVANTAKIAYCNLRQAANNGITSTCLFVAFTFNCFL